MVLKELEIELFKKSFFIIFLTFFLYIGILFIYAGIYPLWPLKITLLEI